MGPGVSEYRGADGADTAFVVQYLYDAQGEPRWVLAVEPTSALAASHPYITFPVHCPGCAWLPDWQTLRAEVGSGSFTLDGPGMRASARSSPCRRTSVAAGNVTRWAWSC